MIAALAPIVDFSAALAALAIAILGAAAALRRRCTSPAAASDSRIIAWRTFAVAVIAYTVLLRLLYFGQLDLMPEEAYYWNYSRHLDIGYLDHPPMVAWLIRLGTAAFGASAYGVRLGALLCGGIAAYFIYGLTRNLFGARSALTALMLAQILPFFFLSGLLMTPDAPLTASWAAALYFLERALIAGRGSAWWRAGGCLGIGMLSKYTIALLIPATLLFVLVDQPSRRWLRRAEPYTAAGLALAIFSPVILWNAQHEWASFAFQTTRRLADQPRFSLHKLIAATLVLITPTGAAAIAGALGVRAPAGAERARAATATDAPADAAADSAAGAATDCGRRRRFAQVYVLVPLAVFAAFSLAHEVKLDWTGETWIAALPAIAAAMLLPGEKSGSRLHAWIRALWPPTIVGLVLVYGAGLYYLARGVPGIGYSRHMELLPVGWRELGRQISDIRATLRTKPGVEPLIVGMDRYATASELAFYMPDRAVSVGNTSSDYLFGGLGLMYARWFPADAQTQRTLLLVAWNSHDISGSRIKSRAARLTPVQEGTLMRRGRFIRHYYYRVLYDYRPATRPR